MMSVRFVPQQHPMPNQRQRTQPTLSQIQFRPQQLNRSSSSSSSTQASPIVSLTPNSSPISPVKTGSPYPTASSTPVQLSQTLSGYPMAATAKGVTAASLGTISPITSVCDTFVSTPPIQSAPLATSIKNHYSNINSTVRMNNSNITPKSSLSPQIPMQTSVSPQLLPFASESPNNEAATFYRFVTAIMEGQLKPTTLDEALSYVVSLAALQNASFSLLLARLTDQQLGALNQFYNQMHSIIHRANTGQLQHTWS
ncbi:hypothetical protein BDF19DRAFT_428318 [Syncephalis fuscata]|nr:hypothetical protein BDF19DRAFT_428318 [Syncephalis fuscata]